MAWGAKINRISELRLENAHTLLKVAKMLLIEADVREIYLFKATVSREGELVTRLVKKLGEKF